MHAQRHGSKVATDFVSASCMLNVRMEERVEGFQCLCDGWGIFGLGGGGGGGGGEIAHALGMPTTGWKSSVASLAASPNSMN